MEILGMPTFDQIDDADLANLNIDEVKELGDQSIDTIHNISQVYISLLKLSIMTPDQLRVSLQGFIDSCLKICLNKVISLICKVKLQLENSYYLDITKMWNVYSKWKDFVTNSS